MSEEEPYTESWLVGPQSTKFYTRTYLPLSQTKPHAAIVFVHGFAEHVGRYTHYHPLFAAQGIAVFTYDQRGFGLTALDTKGNKSKSSSYDKTSWVEQMQDTAWAIQHAKETFPGIPLFLMGHSMGGGEVLGFACQESTAALLKSLCGIIATSPLIHQTHSAPKFQRFIGGLASKIFPALLIPVEVRAEDVSHDPVVVEAYKSDTFVKMKGSLKGITDMLDKGDWLFSSGHSRWPSDIPVFVIHGTADQVANYEASQHFVNHLPEGIVKKIFLFEGGYHELHNEPDGVKEKLAAMIIAFVQEHSSDKNATEELAGTSSEPATRTGGPADTVTESVEGGGAKARM